MRRGGTYLVEDGFGLAQLATMQTGIFQSTLSALVHHHRKSITNAVTHDNLHENKKGRITAAR